MYGISPTHLVSQGDDEETRRRDVTLDVFFTLSRTDTEDWKNMLNYIDDSYCFVKALIVLYDRMVDIAKLHTSQSEVCYEISKAIWNGISSVFNWQAIGLITDERYPEREYVENWMLSQTILVKPAEGVRRDSVSVNPPRI